MNLDKHLIILGKGVGLSAIQLIIADQPFLIIGDGCHTDVFQQGLKRLDVPFEKINAGMRYKIVAPRSDLYRAVGMSLAMAKDNWIDLYGSSSTYGLSPNRKHLEALKPYISEYEIIFD